MSIEAVRAYFKAQQMEDRIQEFEESSETVELAAKVLHTQPCRIAKSLTFWVKEQPIMVVVAGDARIDNAKYKQTFGVKAKMIHSDQVEEVIGHAVGGVCPFALKPNVKVYLDVTLQPYDTVFPAAGSGNSCIELTIAQLEQHAHTTTWVDVCKEKDRPSV